MDERKQTALYAPTKVGPPEHWDLHPGGVGFLRELTNPRLILYVGQDIAQAGKPPSLRWEVRDLELGGLTVAEGQIAMSPPLQAAERSLAEWVALACGTCEAVADLLLGE